MQFGIAQSLRITMKFPKPAFWLAIPVFLVASLALGVNATFGPVAGLAIAALGAAEGVAALSLTRTGTVSKSSPLCASAIRVRQENWL
jgi:hypothetical protein